MAAQTHDNAGLAARIIPAVPPFLVFLAAPIGGLRMLADTSYFYVVRFALIGAAFLFVAAAFYGRRLRLKITHTRIFILYAAVMCANALANTASAGSAALQLGGVSLVIILGAMMAHLAADQAQAIATLVVGYLAGNLAYVVLTALTYGGASFNTENGRFMGPFATGHAATEVFYPFIVLGSLALLRGRVLVGLGSIALGLWVTFITGVRSASAVALLVVGLAVLQVLRGSTKLKIHSLGRVAVGAALAASAALIVLGTPALRSRIAGDDAMVLELDQRVFIWNFGLETLQDIVDGKPPRIAQSNPFNQSEAFPGSSVALGLGTRAPLSWGFSTEGVSYDEPIAWHNTWLALLIEGGVLGLLAHAAILLAVVLPLAGLLRKWFAAPAAVAPLSVAAALIGLRYVLMSVTEMNLYTALSPGVLFFGMVFGVLAVKRAGTPSGSPSPVP